MARFVSFLNPSLVDQEGLHKYLTRLFGPGVATAFNANGWKVTQRGAGANMSVDVAVGDGLLLRPSGDYGFWGWTTATENVAVTAANPTNPRIDTVVAWADTSVTTTGSANSPNALKFQIMAGTPAGSPVAMPDVTIQSTLGAAAAWIKLATINVAAGSTSVVNANISDARTAISGLVSAALADNSVSTNMLQNASVTYTKLLSTIFSDQVQTYTPSGTGGTGYYVNLGGIKLCWGTASNIATGSGAFGYAIGMPSGFFSSIQSATVTAFNMTALATQYANLTATPTTQIQGYIVSTGAGTCGIKWFAIGN